MKGKHMNAESRSQHLKQAQVPLDTTHTPGEQKRKTMLYGNVHTSRPTSARLMSWLILVIVIAVHSPSCSTRLCAVCWVRLPSR